MFDKGDFIIKQLRSYHLHKKLGEGGFGYVYKGEHVYFHDIVAIKVLRTENASQEERAQFIEAAKKHKKLKHSYILPLIDVADEDGILYMVMDYALGGSLSDRLEDHRKKYPDQPLPFEEALTIIQQIGQALYFAHQRSEPIVHLDIKPANILFNERGEALLADFDLATALPTGKTQRFGRAGGTPEYMAPEQFDGDVSVKSDQYALGCIAYELFTGQHPFPVPKLRDDRRWLALYFQHKTVHPLAPIKLNLQLPPSISEAILKALAKDRDHRHVDVLAFLNALSNDSTIPNTVPWSPLQKSFEQLFIEGNEFFGNGRYHNAVIVYKQASKLRPDVADVYVNTGIAFYHLRQYREAVVAFEQAIGCQHNYVKAHYHKGLALHELGQFDQAVAAYRKTVSFQPDHTGAYQELGDTLYKLKRYEEAVKAYERVIQIDPNNANMYNNLGNSLRNVGKCKEAIQAFEHAIQLNPRLAKAYYNKGNAYYGCQKYEEALDAYNGALLENSQYANAYHGKSIALSQLGKLAEARQAEERARQFGYGE